MKWQIYFYYKLSQNGKCTIQFFYFKTKKVNMHLCSQNCAVCQWSIKALAVMERFFLIVIRINTALFNHFLHYTKLCEKGNFIYALLSEHILISFGSSSVPAFITTNPIKSVKWMGRGKKEDEKGAKQLNLVRVSTLYYSPLLSLSVTDPLSTSAHTHTHTQTHSTLRKKSWKVEWYLCERSALILSGRLISTL